MWFKSAAAFSGSQPSQKHLMGGGPANFYFSSSSSMLFYFLSDNIENAGSNSGSWDTNWHSVVVTSDGTLLKMYIDSVVQTDTGNAVGRNIFINSGNLTIGKSTSSFLGNIDDIHLYGEAISASQVQQNYYSGLNNLIVNNGINNVEYINRLTELKNNMAQNNNL